MGEAVEQPGGHLWIAEHARQFAEGEIGRDDDRGALLARARLAWPGSASPCASDGRAAFVQ
jgi:hypothetical protein